MSKSPFLTALFSLRLLVKTVLLLLDWTTAMTFVGRILPSVVTVISFLPMREKARRKKDQECHWNH